MIRARTKALIPIIGAIWAWHTESAFGGASDLGYKDDGISEKTWSWKEAINFHKEILEARLKV